MCCTKQVACVVSNCTDHGLRVAVCPSFPTLKEAQDIHGSIKNRQGRFITALQLLCIHRPPHTNDLDGTMALYLLCISPPLHRLLLAIHYRPTHKMAHRRTKAGRPIAPIPLDLFPHQGLSVSTAQVDTRRWAQCRLQLQGHWKGGKFSLYA